MKVRFWTVQKLDVLTVLLQHGVYQPVFQYSDYVESSPALYDLYDFMLYHYNKLNRTDVPGLVFTFLKRDEDGAIYDFTNFQEFRQFIIDHAISIKALWKNLASKNTVIMCVEKEITDENMMVVDLNDFQYLMPPIIQAYPYSEGYTDFLLNSLSSGTQIQSIFPSNIIQAHIPDIKAEEVIGLYPMFDL